MKLKENKMKKLLKQLFCFHFWKELHREYIGQTKSYSDCVEFGIDHFNIYKINEQCIKCDKERIRKAAELAE